MILLFALLLACSPGPTAAALLSPTGSADAATNSKAPILQEIEKNSDGKLRYFNQNEAIRFCADKGKGVHLPSMREYAELAKARGARGLRETAFLDAPYNDPKVIAEREQNGRDGYTVIYKMSVDNRFVVDFYYNRMGYQKPPADDGIFWFWTSSEAPPDSGLAIAFAGPDGVAHYGFYHFNYYPVRCANGR